MFVAHAPQCPILRGALFLAAMHIGTYFCKTCPLAFEMVTGLTLQNSAGSSRLGWIRGLLCDSCGTMHQLRSYRAGSSELWALPRSFQSPLQLETRRQTDWVNVGHFQDRVTWSSLSCTQCKVQGSLIDQDALRQGGFKCPICQDPFQCLKDMLLH